MICLHCNAEIRDDSNFCIYCGEALGSVSPPAHAQYPHAQYPHYAGPYRLDIVKVLGDTLKLYIRNFGILCLAGLIVMGIPTIVSICQVSLTENMGPPGSFLAIPFLLLLHFLAQCYVAIIAVRQCLHIARGGTGLQEGLMFPPVFMFFNMIGLILIFVCIAMFFMLPIFFMLASAIGFGVMVGGGLGFPMMSLLVLVLFIVMTLPIIWIFTRIWLADCFLVDQNMNCIDALTKSWQVSSGNFWALFGTIFLLFCPVFCWTIACCGAAYAITGNVAVMETIPGLLIFSAGSVPVALLVYFGTGLAYLQLTGQPYQLDMEEKFGFE